MNVVTYQLAYRTEIQVSLCPACAETYRYPLGSVQHGLHSGTCESCESEPTTARCECGAAMGFGDQIDASDRGRTWRVDTTEF